VNDKKQLTILKSQKSRNLNNINAYGLAFKSKTDNPYQAIAYSVIYFQILMFFRSHFFSFSVSASASASAKDVYTIA
jgi:hypothetical protein